jgi:glutamate-1-semialdehyde 2,1-aminomutase
MEFYERNPVVETLYARGRQLRAGFDAAVADHGLQAQLDLASRDCNLLFATRDAQGQPSQPLRTLFMQELIRRGVIAPSFVVSYSHSEQDIERTLDAVHGALGVYRKALEDGVDAYLDGRAVQPVFRRYA